MVHGLAAWLMLAAVAAGATASGLLLVWRRRRAGRAAWSRSSALRLSRTSSGSGAASPLMAERRDLEV